MNSETCHNFLVEFSKRYKNSFLIPLHSKTINIINTCKVLGFSEEAAFAEILKHIETYFPEDSIDGTTLNGYVKSMMFLYYNNISTERDILKEIAASKRNFSTKEYETESIKEALSVYTTIEVEPVKSWDEYYYNIVIQTARNSKCFSRKVGAILVKDKVIISAGYNGPPRGIPSCDMRWRMDADFIKKHGSPTDFIGKCPRKILGAKSGEMMDECLALHGEENAILTCARMGINAKDSTMYVNCGIPCFRCTSKIINTGIAEVVVASSDVYDSTAMYLLKNSNIKIRLYDFI